jgi:chemotaxis signal transduction protein
VNAVVSLTPEQLSEKPVINSSVATDYISNVFRKEETLVLLLDIGKALSLEDKNMLTNQTKRAVA